MNLRNLCCLYHSPYLPWHLPSLVTLPYRSHYQHLIRIHFFLLILFLLFCSFLQYLRCWSQVTYSDYWFSIVWAWVEFSSFSYYLHFYFNFYFIYRSQGVEAELLSCVHCPLAQECLQYFIATFARQILLMRFFFLLFLHIFSFQCLPNHSLFKRWKSER